MLKVLDNLIIGDTSWKTSPFKFNINQLNFAGGDTPTPPTPEASNLGKLKISSTPLTDENYHLVDGALLGLEAGTITTNDYLYNINTQGSITNSSGYISGFSTSNYAVIPNTFTPNSNSWSFDFKIVAPSTITTTETVIAFKDSNSTLIEITVTNDKYVKCTINGTTQTFDSISNGDERKFLLEYRSGVYQLYRYKSIAGYETTVSTGYFNASALPSCNIYLGSNANDSAYSGSINLNACSIKLNNQTWWEGKSRVILTTEEAAEFVEYMADLYSDDPTADYFTTEADWQTEVTNYGVCDKYVYDSNNDTVRIPKYDNKISTAENCTIVGELTNTNGIISGFSENNYLLLPEFSPNLSTWELVIKFKTGDVTTNESVVNSNINYRFSPVYISSSGGWLGYLSTNGTSWDIDTGNILYFSANTDYKLKIEYTGTQYNWYEWSGSSWTLKKTTNNSNPIYGGAQIQLGYGFSGSIDLNETYIKINNKTWFPSGAKTNVNYYIKVK